MLIFLLWIINLLKGKAEFCVLFEPLSTQQCLMLVGRQKEVDVSKAEGTDAIRGKEATEIR